MQNKKPSEKPGLKLPLFDVAGDGVASRSTSTTTIAFKPLAALIIPVYTGFMVHLGKRRMKFIQLFPAGPAV